MIRKVVPITKGIQVKLDIRSAQKRINDLARDSSNVKYKSHAIARKNQRDFNYFDMLRILREGHIQDEPMLKDGYWRYEIRYYRFKSNRDASCIVELREKIIVVTVMWIDIRRT